MPPLRNRYEQGDAPTDRVERAEAAGRRSGEQDVRLEDHERRIGTLEEATAKHGQELSDGRVSFAELRKDVASLTSKVGELTDAIKGAVRWVLGVGGVMVLAAVLWALAHGAKP